MKFTDAESFSKLAVPYSLLQTQWRHDNGANDWLVARLPGEDSNGENSPG